MADSLSFAAFGASFSDQIAGFAAAASTALISELSGPVAAALTLYVAVQLVLIAYGRGDFKGLVLSALKVGVISFFALQSGNFVSYVIPAVKGLEAMLVNAFGAAGGSGGASAWAQIDTLWSSSCEAMGAMVGLLNGISVMSNPGAFVVFSISLVVVGILAAFLTFASVGTLLLAEILLTVTLGFGPLFLCTLMFPATRNWFDGWVRTVLGFVFAVVMTAAAILLFVEVLQGNVSDIREAIERTGTEDPDFTSLYINLAFFGVLCLTAKFVIQAMPAVGAALAGGGRIGALSAGQLAATAAAPLLTAGAAYGEAKFIANSARSGFYSAAGNTAKAALYQNAAARADRLTHHPGIAAAQMLGAGAGLPARAVSHFRHSVPSATDQAVRAANSGTAGHSEHHH